LPIGAASAADASKQPRAEQGTTFELSARKRHHHYRRGNSRAAMQMFGMVAGTIASIAAAQHARNYYDRYDGYGYYGHGYARTLGDHSRIAEPAVRVAARLPHGNVYVNRNMIGAVVGSQPFGGSGRSGTGPKAGGPHYLARFTLEQVVTVNTAAAGGNASLLAEEE
jgi:hypothetical protein